MDAPMNACRVRQSFSVLSGFKCRSIMLMFKKNNIRGEMIFHFKRRLKRSEIVLLQMKGLIQIIVKFRTKKICARTFLSIIKHKHPLEGHT